MSLAYHRMKLRATTTAVGYMRRLCDGCNVVIGAVASPFRKIGRRVSQEAPWVNFILGSTFVVIIPLSAYPYLRPILRGNDRYAREEERVRLCLQKGIDPYPYLKHKEFLRGNNIPLYSDDQKLVPFEAVFEHKSIIDFHKKKEEIRRQTGGDLDASVEQLMRLREEHKANYRQATRDIGSQPKETIFPPRQDVDVLKT